MTIDQKQLTSKAIALLQELISIQSFSSEEDKTADAIENWFTSFNIPFKREKNNVYARIPFFHILRMENYLDWAVMMQEAVWCH